MGVSEHVKSIRNVCVFGEYRAYILMGIARRKFNDELTHNSEVVCRKVISDEGDVEQAVEDLWVLMARHDLHWRVYLSVNARNTLKTYFNFREEMNKWSRDLVHGDDHVEEKLGRVSSHWKSALHRPEVRDDKYFQFDLDDIDHGQYLSFVESLPAQDGSSVTNPSDSVFRYKRQTPNGYHVITEPFNYTEWESPIDYDDLDNDGELFIAEIDCSLRTDTGRPDGGVG